MNVFETAGGQWTSRKGPKAKAQAVNFFDQVSIEVNDHNQDPSTNDTQGLTSTLEAVEDSAETKEAFFTEACKLKLAAEGPRPL